MWSRVCVDVNHRGDVLGYSVEVHNDDGPTAIHVFPNGPFDDPAETFGDALDWLHTQYGEQLELSLF